MDALAQDKRPVRIAAAGDIHCSPHERPRIEAAFSSLDSDVDAVLLAGDLTAHGEPEEATVLADARRHVEAPVFAVLGNHDWHTNRAPEIAQILEAAGITILDGRAVTFELRGQQIGIAGVKGFVGGFPDATLPDFGEPSLRRVYAETTAEVASLEQALEAIERCDVRIALLHYAPTTTTLGSEPPGIWAFLGSDRLSRPIRDHRPDFVLHGHAHAGAFEGFIGAVPVYNVAVHVTGRDFWIFELDRTGRDPTVERAPEPPAA